MFAPAPGVTYLDAATYGLPPTSTVEALERAVAGWRSGTARWVDDWDRPAEAARGMFAELIGATAADIAFIPAASIGTGLVAASLVSGDVVVVPDDGHVPRRLKPRADADRTRGRSRGDHAAGGGCRCQSLHRFDPRDTVRRGRRP